MHYTFYLLVQFIHCMSFWATLFAEQADPLLTAEERGRVLGGMAEMWGEQARHLFFCSILAAFFSIRTA